MLLPVPSQRCVLLVSLLLPISLLELIVPALGWLVFSGIALLLLLALIDMFVAPQAFDHLRVEVEPVTRLARGSPGKIMLHLNYERAAPVKILLGLPLPVEFAQESDIRQLDLAGGSVGNLVVEWPVVAHSRGVFDMPSVYVEVGSLLGLFRMRRRYPSDAELRVYPNLQRERSQLANLFLNRGNIGIHAQRMIGQGSEYEQLREYSTGDSMLDIHWKASAKRGELVTKTYQVERTQEIYLVIDHSRLSGRRSTCDETGMDEFYSETVLERYVTAASVLGMATEQEGDLLGLIAFGQQVSRFVRAGAGKPHGQAIQDALFDLKTEYTPSDLNELFTFIRMHLRQRALVIFMTDLCDSAAAHEFRKHIGMLATQHYIIVNSMRRENVSPLYTKHSDDSRVGISEQIAGHLQWSRLQQLKVELRVAGVEFSVLDDEKLSFDLVNQYLAVKRKQLL